MADTSANHSANYIGEIETLAGAFRKNERNLPLYFPDFSKPPAADSLNRVFGPPVGVTDTDWPQNPASIENMGDLVAGADERSADDVDARMEHVFTVDLRDIQLQGTPPRARAMMLFISDARKHSAHQNGNVETAVVFLSEDELARGPYRGSLPERSRARWSRRFSLARIDVPGDVFDIHDDEGSPIALLHDAIWQAPARLGGCPIWVREPSDPRDFTPVRRPQRPPSTPGPRGRNAFMMQFERRFADIHLGHQGVMYVSGVGAYYQSYD